MADMIPTAPTAPVTSTNGVGGATAAPTTPKTRSQLMAGIRSGANGAPHISTPTVTSPTAPAAEKPAGVEAVKLEMGGAASGGVEPSTTDVVDPNVDPGVETAEPSATEPIDYAQKFAEIMDSGDLHESMYDKMGIAKIDGQEYPVSVREAFKGYMRRSDHSKAMNEVQQLEHSVKAEQTRIAELWGTLKDRPELALEVFGERFGDGWLDQMVATRQRAVEAYEGAILDAGHRVVSQLGINPEHAAQDPRVLAAMGQAKERLDRQKTLEAENRALKRKAEEFEKAQAAASSKQEEASYGDRFVATVKRFADAALKAEGLPVNELSKSDLQSTVAQLLIAKNQGVRESERNYSITQDLVREAAGILRENREDGARRGGSQEQPLPPRQGMGVGTGAVSNVAAKGAPQTRTQLFGSLRGQRR